MSKKGYRAKFEEASKAFTFNDVINQLVGGLQASMGYIGARSIDESWVKARFALITQAGQRELQPHDIILPGRIRPNDM